MMDKLYQFYLCLFPEHKFNWKMIMNAPTNTRARKNLEADLIALKRPSLNDQMNSNQLILFRHSVKLMTLNYT